MNTSPSSPPPAASPPAIGGQLVRLTVNLNARSAVALENLARTTNTSKTDVVNRALQIYALIEELTTVEGGQLRVVKSDGSVEGIRLL